jgi:pimeloyl-ACP methyl ester carboxylesterase
MVLGRHHRVFVLDQFGTENLKGVVVIDQTPTPLAPAQEQWGDGGPEVVKQSFDDFTANRMGTVRGFIPWMYSKGVTDEDASWMVAETMMTPAIVASQLLYDGWMRDWSETFKKVDVPMLHFVREENGPAAQRFIEQNNPQAEMIVMGGHGMFWDHPDDFNEALSAFVAKAK